MRCHWSEDARDFTTPMGTQAVSRAVVFLDSNIDPDGFLYLGVSSAASPRAVRGADRIQQVEKKPTLRLDVTVYVAFL